MSKRQFPKTEKLMQAELEAWTYVFQKLELLEERIKVLEGKIH